MSSIPGFSISMDLRMICALESTKMLYVLVSIGYPGVCSSDSSCVHRVLSNLGTLGMNVEPTTRQDARCSREGATVPAAATPPGRRLHGAHHHARTARRHAVDDGRRWGASAERSASASCSVRLCCNETVRSLAGTLSPPGLGEHALVPTGAQQPGRPRWSHNQ